MSLFDNKTETRGEFCSCNVKKKFNLLGSAKIRSISFSLR